MKNKLPRYLTVFNSKLFRQRRQSLNLTPESFDSTSQLAETSEKGESNE